MDRLEDQSVGEGAACGSRRWSSRWLGERCHSGVCHLRKASDRGLPRAIAGDGPMARPHRRVRRRGQACCDQYQPPAGRQEQNSRKRRLPL